MFHPYRMLDRCKFPMILVGELYFHLLPVTKIQLEHFLSDARDGHFSQAWYDTVLRLNPRCTTRRLWLDNYWQAFATGILPGEAERFAAWCGKGFRLPTHREWSAAYAELAKKPTEGLLSEADLDQLSERAKELVPRIETHLVQAAQSAGFKPGAETSCAFRLGVLEWVVLEGEAPGRWGAMGEPNPAFCGNLLRPERGEMVRPFESEKRRDRSFGFRLVFDPKSGQSH